MLTNCGNENHLSSELQMWIIGHQSPSRIRVPEFPRQIDLDFLGTCLVKQTFSRRPARIWENPRFWSSVQRKQRHRHLLRTCEQQYCLVPACAPAGKFWRGNFGRGEGASSANLVWQWNSTHPKLDVGVSLFSWNICHERLALALLVRRNFVSTGIGVARHSNDKTHVEPGVGGVDGRNFWWLKLPQFTAIVFLPVGQLQWKLDFLHLFDWTCSD